MLTVVIASIAGSKGTQAALYVANKMLEMAATTYYKALIVR